MQHKEYSILNTETNINSALELLSTQQLDKAIKALQPIYNGKPSVAEYNEYMAIVSDYNLMCEYMLRGFKDPAREKLYASLIERLYRVAANLLLSWKCKNNPTFIDAFHTSAHFNLSHNLVRSALEGFVTDVAMLSLTPENERISKEAELYKRHQTFVERLFCALLTSSQWLESDATFYIGLLTSPTIDAADQMLIVSAITLSAMSIYDIKKLKTLVDVYRQASDIKVRQRALVGCVLSLTNNNLFRKEQAALINSFITTNDAKHELLNLQKQMFNCMDAERDNDRIQRDIMPNIVRNSDLHFDRFGISEKENSSLENILHPDADEEKMEKMEESIQKMMNMQKQGSDIYFGGFSKMKRFPFFDHIANWFMPFSAHHPGLEEVAQKLGDGSLLDRLAGQDPFCESDKYSLALTIAQIVNQLPPNILELIKSGEGIGLPNMEPIDHSPAFTCRMYIQDLYRFFEVKMASNKDIPNPFKADGDYKAFFMLHDLFIKDFYIDAKESLAMFLYKHKREADIEKLTGTYQSDSAMYRMFRGIEAIRMGNEGEALEHFAVAVGLEPDNVLILRTVGAVVLRRKGYGIAIICYNKLCELEPNVKAYAINQCLCLAANGDTKTAVNKAYELSLKNEDDNQVKRLLAWVLICDGNAEKALNIYNELINTDKQPDDALNMAYAYWISGNPTEAKNSFTEWLINHPGANLEHEFENDSYVFKPNGITEVDRALMLSAINR